MKRGFQKIGFLFLFALTALYAQTDSVQRKLEVQREDSTLYPTRYFVDGRAVYRRGKYGAPSKRQLDITKFRSGLLNVMENGFWGYKNIQGDWVIPPKYEEAEPFQVNLAIVRQGSTYELIDTLGRNVLPFVCDYIQKRSPDWFELVPLVIAKEKKYGCMKVDGTIVVPFEYSHIEINAASCYQVRKNNYVGLYTQNGRLLVEANTYDNISLFDTLYYVEKQGKRGLLDIHGRILVSPIYDAIETMNYAGEPYFHIQKDTHWGLMSKDFVVLIAPTYDARLSPFSHFSEKKQQDETYYMVKLKNKMGIINAKGQVKIPCKYDAISVACSDLLRIYQRKNIPAPPKLEMLMPERFLCGWATLSGKILQEPIQVTVPCRYPENQIFAIPPPTFCAMIRQAEREINPRNQHTCDDPSPPSPCLQCAQECPDESWLKAHGYYNK